MKLPTLLRSLQPAEYKEFEKFLQSPFFKASEQYLTFFRCLRKHYPTFELDRADLETAYRRCFGPQSFTDTKLHNLSSGLGKQIEQFLVAQMVFAAEGKTESDLYQTLLVKALGKRNTDDYFRDEAQELIDAMTARPVMEADNYLALQQLHHHLYYNPDTPKFKGPSPTLQAAADHLDRYYCLAKLGYAAEMKARERIVPNHPYAYPLLEAVLAYGTTRGGTETLPAWAVYQQLVDLYRQKVDESGFRHLMRVFDTQLSLLSRNDQLVLLRHLINIGIALIERGGNLEPELLSLYKVGLDAGLLPDGQRMTYNSFINIANLAILCLEFDWVKAFINQFSAYLEEDKRLPAVALAEAGLYYNQGRLDEAQICLRNEAIFSIDSFALLGRSLLLKIIADRYLADLQTYEFLMAQIKSFDRLVLARPLLPERKKAQLNWSKFLRKIVVLKFNMVQVPAEKKAALRKKLQLLQPVAYKKWLAARIDAL